MGFCLLWAGWCVLFFSLSRGKLPPYVLPAVPALALALGRYLAAVSFGPGQAAFFRDVRTRVPRQALLVLSVAGLAGNAWAWRAGWFGPARHPSVVAALAVCCGCLAAAVFRRGRRGFPAAWLACCVLDLALVWEAAHGLVPAWAAQRSPLAHADGVQRLVRGGAGVACRGEDWGSVAFQLDADEAFLNNSGRPVEELQSFLASHPCAMLIVNGPNEDIARSALPTGCSITKVANSGKARVLYVRPRSGAAGRP